MKGNIMEKCIVKTTVSYDWHIKHGWVEDKKAKKENDKGIPMKRISKHKVKIPMKKELINQ